MVPQGHIGFNTHPALDVIQPSVIWNQFKAAFVQMDELIGDIGDEHPSH
jgi:hypothetical protein